MKKAALILLLGVLVSAAAFAGFYYLGTAPCRAMMSQPQPELAWLKKEFNLSDAEFDRITKLHEAYLPQCAQRCMRIAEQNRKLQQLLSGASSISPEIKNVLAQRAKTRADCEAEMLNHFLEVSRTMPPEQGRRYLQWVEKQTFLNGQAMEERHKSSNSMAQEPHM
ncbi:MAG: hypothetical protein ACREIC_18770 [Limisphaerales bacterium]